MQFGPWVGKIPWRRAWLPTPVFLPEESHGQSTLVGYSPWGHTALAAGWIRGAYRPTDSFTASDLLWGPLKLWGEARYKAEQSVSRRRLPPQGRGQPGSSAGQEGTSCFTPCRVHVPGKRTVSSPLWCFCLLPWAHLFLLLSSEMQFQGCPPARFSNSILILPGLGMGRWLCGSPGGKSLSNYGYRLPATKRTLSNQVHGHTIQVSKNF